MNVNFEVKGKLTSKSVNDEKCFHISTEKSISFDIHASKDFIPASQRLPSL